MKPSVCAVSFLNTTPLIWGLQFGPQRHKVSLDLALPSRCAARLAEGSADVGLVPAIELIRQPLRQFGALGIAAENAVRSILLISKVPFGAIRTLAADSSSRTSVGLARLILRDVYSCEPHVISMKPDLAGMLAGHDAALIIGDPALRLEPDALPYSCLDLGTAWTDWTGLPMVFAVWAGRNSSPIAADLERDLQDSFDLGWANLEQIICAESRQRGFPENRVREYLTHQIRYELGPREKLGLEHYLSLVKTLKTT